MLILALLFLVVLFQLYSWHYDYRHTADKKLFWRWHRFRLPVTLGVLVFIAFMASNFIFPSGSLTTPEEKIRYGEQFNQPKIAYEGYHQLVLSADSNKANPDLNYEVIRNYERMYRGTEDYGTKMWWHGQAYDHFFELSLDGNSLIRDIGNWGLAWIANNQERTETAVDHLGKIKTNNRKYQHLLQARLLYDYAESAACESELKQEIEIGGAVGPATELLSSLYYYTGNYTGVDSLLDLDVQAVFVPRWIAAERYFHQGDWIGYYAMVLRRFRRGFNGFGALAAFLILMVWSIYLLRIDVFKRESWINLGIMAVAGMFFSFGVESISDFLNYHLNFSLDGTFWGDFLYCVLGIGAVEELVKIVPFLLFWRFTKVIREPADYLIYAAASALGFAFVENLLYINSSGLANIQGRALMAVVSHMFDSSLIAYCIVLARYRYKKSPWIGLAIGFGLAAFAHGFYDFWLIHKTGAGFLTFIFFLATLHLWGTMMNNSLNNSPYFDIRKAFKNNNLQYFLVTALASLMLLQYLIIGWNYGLEKANQSLFRELAFGGYMILYLASSISRFDFVRGYWAPFRLPTNPFLPSGGTPQNYVGYTIQFHGFPNSDKMNKYLPLEGHIVNRVVLGTNPNYFLVQLSRPLNFKNYDRLNVLIRIKNPFQTLNETDKIIVGVRLIPDMEMLHERKKTKNDFPFVGWLKVHQTGEAAVVRWTDAPNSEAVR